MTTPMYMLADDLAGAHDVAVPFAKRGFAVAVPSGPDRLDRFNSADLVVLNTETRSCTEAEAAARVGAACEAIRSRNGSIVYKKIDSTLRGHVGFEIDLVCDLMDFRLAVCAPAFPELGRTTVGGYHLLHGLPVCGADMAGPDNPPRHAYIPDLLDTGAGRKTALIDLKTSQGATTAIREAVSEFRSGTGPGTSVVVDMVEPARWNSLLDAVLESNAMAPGGGSPAGGSSARDAGGARASTLLCGSGGMAGALADRLASAQRPQAMVYDRKPGVGGASRDNDDRPVLVFACSLHATTARQVEQVRDRNSAAICPFDPLMIVDERCRGEEVDRLEARVAEELAKERNAVVTPLRPGRSERRAWLEKLAGKAAGRDPASVVIENLGEVARRLFANASPGGLMLTGGETAGSVFHELNADGAWILEEIDSGVGLAAVAGGPHEGMGLVIKPGSFGDEQTLVKAMDRLRPRSGDSRVAGARDRGGDRIGRRHSSEHQNAKGADDRPVIGITVGDPNGVGPEVIVKALSQEWVYKLCRPLVIGHDEVIRRALPLAGAGRLDDGEAQRAGTLDEEEVLGGAVVYGDAEVHGGAEAHGNTGPDLSRNPGPCLEIHRVDRPGESRHLYGTVDVLNAGETEIDKLVPGRVQSEAGRLAVESVKLAARLAMAGDIAALVTAPMNKAAMSQAGYTFAGHTELLAEITGTKRFRLALAFDGILVSHATTHVSLRDAIDRLSEDEILITIDLVGSALAGMGVAAPRIAVCGLNPHAGEGGLFGDEEIRIIAPAIEKARKKSGARGWRITGPLPPDTVFMRARKGGFDGVVGMYHDQGHIPVKAIAFDRTVNVTLGLPIIRTSVDHGTAFDIAGKGVADAGNLGEALRMAVKLVGEQWSIGDGQGAQTAS